MVSLSFRDHALLQVLLFIWLDLSQIERSMHPAVDSAINWLAWSSDWCFALQGGILAIDIAPDNSSIVATAGSDHIVHLFDCDTSRVTANLSGHTKKVTGKSLASA